MKVHQTATCLHSLSATSYGPHKTPELGKSLSSWCLVHSSSHEGLLFAQLQHGDGDHWRGYHSHQDQYSVTMCGTVFCPCQTTRANASHCLFNTQNFWVITAWYAAVRFRPVPPTLSIAMSKEGFHESWNLSCISVHSSLPITVYMWNIST